MHLKHKENELRTMSSTVERMREDYAYNLQEALDKQHDRLTADRTSDIQNINARNEVLIRQLVDFQNAELRKLREQLLSADRMIREKEHVLSNLELHLQNVLPDREHLKWSEKERLANLS